MTPLAAHIPTSGQFVEPNALQFLLLVIVLTLTFLSLPLLGRRVLGRWIRRTQLQRRDRAVPEHWDALIRSKFSLANTLPPPLFRELLQRTSEFIETKHFEGANGLTVTDDMRVLVASQACYLLIGTDFPCYPKLRTVILYPSSFVSEEREFETFGESWDLGIIVLSWNHTLHGAAFPRDGSNVVFHEFAHQLDQDSGGADGVPAGLYGDALRSWSEVLAKEYKLLRRHARRGQRDVLNYYGAENRAEFFAVASETFFEQPQLLFEHRPLLYRELSQFYQRDPIEEQRVISQQLEEGPESA